MDLPKDVRMLVHSCLDHKTLRKFRFLSQADNEMILGNTSLLERSRIRTYVNRQMISGIPDNVRVKDAIKSKFAFAHTIDIYIEESSMPYTIAEIDLCRSFLTYFFAYVQERQKRVNIEFEWDDQEDADIFFFDLVTQCATTQNINRLSASRVPDYSKCKVLAENFAKKVPMLQTFEFDASQIPEIDFQTFSNTKILLVHEVYEQVKMDLKPCESLQELIFIGLDLRVNLDIKLSSKIQSFGIVSCFGDILTGWLLRNLPYVRTFCQSMVVHYLRKIEDLDFSDFEDKYQVQKTTDSRSKMKITLTSKDDHSKIEIQKFDHKDFWKKY